MADENARKIAEHAEADRKAAAKAREEQLADSRKQADADTKAHYERVSASQPTPTQEENDRAKLGFQTLEELDDKEPDGSPEERDLTAGGAAPYTTRVAAAKK